MIMLWLTTPASRQIALMVDSVPRRMRSSPGQLALCTTSMGASSGQPAARSSLSTLCSRVMER